MTEPRRNVDRACIFALLVLASSVAVTAAGGLGEMRVIAIMITPALCALLMLFAFTGEGRKPGAWASLGLTRAGRRGWWLAVTFPAVALVVSDVILVGIGLARFTTPAMTAPAAQIALGLGLNLATGLCLAFTEELGWRGYMLPRLAAIGPIAAVLVTGFVHGLWHLPIMLMTPYYHAGGNPMFIVPLFMATLTLAGIFYGYLRLWTDSVWPVAIAHAVFNFVWNVSGDFSTTRSPETLEYVGGESGVLMIAILLIAAALLIPRIRRLSVMREG